MTQTSYVKLHFSVHHHNRNKNKPVLRLPMKDHFESKLEAMSPIRLGHWTKLSFLKLEALILEHVY